MAYIGALISAICCALHLIGGNKRIKEYTDQQRAKQTDTLHK